jgi:hypothetical protein
VNPPGLSLLTFNIGNPSPERAQRQLAWLARRDEHVLVLTETKASAGCRLLVGAFTAAGYHVTYPEPGEYGTMIISRVAAAPDGFGDQIGYLPSRAVAVILLAPAGRCGSSACTYPRAMPVPRRPSASGDGWPPATPRSRQSLPGCQPSWTGT